jgi:hypothetical protein
MGPTACAYLDYVQSAACAIHRKPQFIRELYRLAGKMSGSLLHSTLERALEYRVASIDSLERIAEQLLRQRDSEEPLDTSGPKGYEHRPAYEQGRFSTEADLCAYQKLLGEQEDG